MSKYKCEKCGKAFKSEEGLQMHLKDKHSGEKSFDFRKLRLWVISLIVVFLVVFGVIWVFNSLGDYANRPASEINIGGHNNIAQHIHADLMIEINGEEVFIPADVGLSDSYMRPLHTHDSSGEIHIEGPAKRDFSIGEFFEVWERNFNSTCIFDNCEPEGELRFMVNGEENTEYGNYIMNDGDSLLIEFEE